MLAVMVDSIGAALVSKRYKTVADIKKLSI
jgi:hypothetical protein